MIMGHATVVDSGLIWTIWGSQRIPKPVYMGIFAFHSHWNGAVIARIEPPTSRSAVQQHSQLFGYCGGEHSICINLGK